MTESPQVDVVILTPGLYLMGDYVKSLLALSQELAQRKITWAYANEYSSHVADAREITLAGTRNNTVAENKPFMGNLSYKKLLWIDSDIAFKPMDAIKLIESDKDIISGAYLLADGSATAYKEPMGYGFTFDEILEMKEPIQVYSVGFGFLCIKQGVFEKMTRPWFQSVPITIERQETSYTFNILGEDLSFCHRAHELGFDVWLDPSVRVQHHKLMKLTWEGIKP